MRAVEEKGKRTAKLTWHSADPFKLPLFKQHLIMVLPDVSEVEDGLGDEERGSRRIDLSPRG